MRSDLFGRRERNTVQRTVVLLVVALLAVGGVATIGGVAGTDNAGVPTGGFEQMDVDPDDVLINVGVEPNGDAIWEIQYRVRLATDDEEQAFEELRADIDDDPEAYTDRFRERMVATADAAETATGREMRVTDTTVTAERRELPQSYGVVTYQFRWHGFAAVDDDRLVIGDAIDGMFLDGASSLILSWPDGYEVVDVSPSPAETRDAAVVWTGPIDFTGGEPRLTVEPEGISGLSAVLVGIGLLVAVGGAVAYRRRRDGSSAAADDGATTAVESSGSTGQPDDPAASGGTADTDPVNGRDTSGVDTEEATDSGQPADVGQPTDTERPSDAGGSTGDGPEAGSAGAGAGSASVDEALLSNEEQVLRLIEANGGRMKQKQVVEELDWTAAKTSQVVTGLRDDGELDGFRLGRENVLSLPDFDATAETGDEATDEGDEDGTAGDGDR